MADNGKIVTLSGRDISIGLCVPDVGTGYYRGTRFDWTGVFRKIVFKGAVFADEWFDAYDPFRHDCVCGPSEEFTQVGYDDVGPGGTFLKIGVGLLRRADTASYDRFRLYDIADPGVREFSSDGRISVFIHSLGPVCVPDASRECLSGLVPGYGYFYRKDVGIMEAGNGFFIAHHLRNTGFNPIECHVYNHNFFNMSPVGPDTRIDFPFIPCGTWREPYRGVCLSDSGIRFNRSLGEKETVFMGNLRPACPEACSVPALTDSYSFRLSSFDHVAGHALSVRAECNAMMDYAVFWANSRVACVEPYTRLNLLPGDSAEWKITYFLEVLP